MAIIETAMRLVHLLAGGVLTGSVVFFAWGVTRSDAPNSDPVVVAELAATLTTISRGCAMLLLVSGGYMAARLGARLQGRLGLLVGVMVLLWLIVTALVEVANARLDGDGSVSDVRQLYHVAAIASLLLLLEAGYVAAT